MANLDDLILARRQKDMDGYIELYLKRLDNITGQFMKELEPAWQRMTKTLQDKVKKIYQDLGAVQDPRRLEVLKNRIDRLEALQSQLAQDLKDMGSRLQPYYTGKLKNIFEDSYYFHLFGLEKSAKVKVAAPVLTADRILGILANPWLPDGANYSDRIRANTAFLASNMRKVMAKAISEGWGWNETAHMIQATSGEGYYAAVRLARTEFTRASALASTYSYMANSDILDGKRWNATLDSRVAPKDAKNDGKIYDLDYDTTENPGVPGQRIPNHPHCRCRWTPVLSALGVSKKERIARGDGDSPTSWGARTYTNARTYEEYSKERGLPDLTERLRNDNLKAYLRPGEKSAELLRDVKRWTYNGAAITVPKPIWDQAQQTAAQPVQFDYANYLDEAHKITDPQKWYEHVMSTADNLITKDIDLEAIKAAQQTIAKLTIEAGKDADSLIVSGPGVTLRWAPAKLRAILDKFNGLTKGKDQDGLLKDLEEKYKGLSFGVSIAQDYEKRELRSVIQIIKDSLYNSRKNMYKQAFKNFKLEDFNNTGAAFDGLHIELPAGTRSRELKDAVTSANEWLVKHMHPGNAGNKPIEQNTIKKGARAYALSTLNKVCLPTDTNATTAVHEAAHCIHKHRQETIKVVDLFFKDRIKGDKLTQIYSGTSEYGYKDKFIDHYVGKIYDFDKAGEAGTEVVSMGMQYMYDDPIEFYRKDPEHFKLMYAILRGLQL